MLHGRSASAGGLSLAILHTKLATRLQAARSVADAFVTAASALT